MADFLGSVWWMIVSLGVLVTFHEFGHYWVARRCGVKVLRFSVGFGRPLWSRRNRNGTGAAPFPDQWLVEPNRLDRLDDVLPDSPAKQRARRDFAQRPGLLQQYPALRIARH